MTFNPTYNRLDEREPVTADHLNQLRADIIAHANNLTGADLEAPLVLSRSGQHVDGNNANYVHSFFKWFGDGSDAVIRDITGKGAVGDGSTDNYDAIMDAIDDLPSTGGVILVPPGTWLVSDTLDTGGRNPKSSPKASVTLWGQGPSCVIKLQNSADKDVIRMNGVNHSIIGIKIDGNYTNQTSATEVNGIDGMDSTDCLIDGCQVVNVNGNGIDVGGSTGLLIANTRIHNCQKTGITHGDTSVGSNLTIANVFIENVGSSAFAFGDCISLIPCPTSTIIRDCQIDSSIGNGIRCGTSSDSMLSSLTISGCVITQSGSSSIALDDTNGIYITSNNNGVSARGILVNSCHISGGLGHGVYLGSSNGGILVGFAIQANTIYDNDRNGIKIYRAKYGSIASNSISNNGVESSVNERSGIHLDGGVGSEAQGISITDNVCSDDTGTPVQEYGIYLGANTKDNVIVGNSFSGNETLPITDSGTNNEIAHNAGYP